MKERKRKITMRVKSLIAASNETRVALVIMNTISKILYDVYICTYVRMCTYVSVCVGLNRGNFSRENRDRVLGRTRCVKTKYTKCSCITSG